MSDNTNDYGFTLGKAKSGGESLNIGGRPFNFENVPRPGSGQYTNGENLLVAKIDDDNQVVIGFSGYRSSL